MEKLDLRPRHSHHLSVQDRTGAAPGKLTNESRERANGLLKRLRQFDVVIDCDPSSPPIVGLTSLPGFTHLPRTVEDKNFVMKIKPETRITPLGDKIWRMVLRR